MSIVLYRVDERLIHGQVVLGWGSELRPDRFLVVDDDLAGSNWEQDLYRLGSGEAATLFATVAEARASLSEWRESAERSILLTRDVRTMRRLAEGGLLEGETLNLGGLHHGPGRRQVLTYLHLTDQDRQDLAQIADAGMEITARDLPDAHRVPLSQLLKT